MIIDAHNHPDWHGHNFDRFIANMKKFNIDKTWLLPRECPDNEVHIEFLKSYTPGVPGVGQLPFSRCLSYAERAPEKFILGFSPDPRRPESLGQLEAAVDIYDVRICGEIKLRMMYDNIDAIRIYECCAKHKLPVVLHLENPYFVNGKEYWFGGGMEVLESVLQQCPDTIFLGHGPGFWSYISGDDKQNELYPEGDVLPGGLVPGFLRKYPNLYCDMSANSCKIALARDKKFTQEFCDEFQDRILYARDCFHNEHQELLEDLNLPGDIKDKIYSANALKLTANN
jgi:predicted TIM-barrel fold metal-dependent hydrolase